MNNPQTIGAIQVTTLAYTYQQNLFQIFSAMKVKTNANYQKMNIIGLLTTYFVYIAVAVISLIMFGSDIHSSVLINIGDEKMNQGRTFWEGCVIQCSFCIVLICHIPFIFFSGKEGLLIMIDETHRKSMSMSLHSKLHSRQSLNTCKSIYKEKATTTEETGKAGSAPSDEKNHNAYLTMKTSIYLIASLIYYIAIVFGAIAISSISILFDFIGAFAISGMAFLFPAYLYLRAVKKFEVPVEGQTSTNIKLSYMMLVLGFLCTALGIFSTIYEIVHPED